MMLLVFAVLSLAFIAAEFGPRWLGLLSVLICLALSIGLFLFEIYSPEYGFRMPWLEVQFDSVPPDQHQRLRMTMATGVRLQATLNDLFLLAMMFVIAAILTTAMVLQFHDGEIPCPLCLLQRVAMFGVCFGIVLHFRSGYSARHTGISLLFALFLLIVAGRQTLLDIYPRPGHSYTGSAVFGLHMPVWSVIIAAAILLAFAIKLAALGDEELGSASSAPLLRKLGGLLSFYVVALCLINFGSVFLQCGIDACHTFGYKLLGAN